MTAQRKQFKRFKMTGVKKDIPANEMPPDIFSDVRNMESFDVGMIASKGIERAFGAPLFPPEHLTFNKGSAAFHWLYASSGGIGLTNGENHFDITPAAGVNSVWPTTWTAANLNNTPVFNNNVDVPVFWDNVEGNIMQPIPNWPANTTALSMRAFNNNLIAMNITDLQGEFTNFLMWSNSAGVGEIPDEWTPLPENDAGFVALSDTVGGILDGVAFRDSFMLLKEHSTYLMRYIGGNFVFAFRKLFSTSGVLSTNCAVEYLGNVAILTDGDFILTDGQRADSLIDKKMRRWLFNNIDTDNFRSTFVTAYHSANQIWICFPENGEADCTLALVWDITDNKFGIRELRPTPHIARGQVGNITGTISWEDDPEPWEDDVTSWNQALFNPTEDALLQADRVNTRLYAINEGIDRDGDTILTRLERIGLDFDEPEIVKLVRSVVLRISGELGAVLQVRLGSSFSDSEPVKWGNVVDYVIGQTEKVDVFAQGRFIAFKIEGHTKQLAWNFYGIDFNYDLQGRY